jgi:hypothetical protein
MSQDFTAAREPVALAVVFGVGEKLVGKLMLTFWF